MATCSASIAVLELARALGVPDKCVSFSLNAAVGEALTVTAEYFPSDEQIEAAHSVIRKYRLVEEKEPCRS